MFINQLPVRLRISRDDTFGSLLNTARTSARSALSHQEMPFPRLVEAIAPDADRSQPPIFQVLLNVLPPQAPTRAQETQSPTFRDPDLEEMRSLLELHSKFDFTLYALERGGELQLGFVYDAALFDETRMSGLVDDIEQALRRGVELPESRVDELWSETPGSTASAADAPEPVRSVIDAFLRSLEAAPDHPALVGEEAPLSYAQLHGEAKRLAALVATAAGGDVSAPVGIAVPHGSSAVAALLGVLGAGVPYVPLDPGYPKERLHFMLQDAGVRVVLTAARSAIGDRELPANGVSCFAHGLR